MHTNYREYFIYIGIMFKFFRRLSGLSQEEVARKAGINCRHYQRIESGDLLNITLETLHILACVFKIKINDLIYNKDEFNEETYKIKNISFAKNSFLQIIKEIENINEKKKMYSIVNSLKKNKSYIKFDNKNNYDFCSIIENDFSYACSKGVNEFGLPKKVEFGKNIANKKKLLNDYFKLLKEPKKIIITKHKIINIASPFEATFISKILNDNYKKPIILNYAIIK